MNDGHGVDESPESADTGIDIPAALAMAGGDVDLLRELVGAFVVEVPRLLDRLGSAVDQKDSETLGDVAHQLQGVMRCLHLERALEQARRLEMQGTSEPDWPVIEDSLAVLRTMIDSAIQALTDYLNERA